MDRSPRLAGDAVACHPIRVVASSALGGLALGVGLWSAVGLILMGIRVDAEGTSPGTAELILLWGGLVVGVAAFVAALVLLVSLPVVPGAARQRGGGPLTASPRVADAAAVVPRGDDSMAAATTTDSDAADPSDTFSLSYAASSVQGPCSAQ